MGAPLVLWYRRKNRSESFSVHVAAIGVMQANANSISMDMDNLKFPVELAEFPDDEEPLT